MLKPLHDYVSLILDDKLDKTSGGIILTQSKEKQPQSGKVIAVGPKVKDIKVGDHVGFELGQFRKLFDGEQNVAFVKEEHITGVFDE